MFDKNVVLYLGVIIIDEKSGEYLFRELKVDFEVGICLDMIIVMVDEVREIFVMFVWLK